VETKAATLQTGVKVYHLTYIGDAEVGANTNIAPAPSRAITTAFPGTRPRSGRAPLSAPKTDAFKGRPIPDCLLFLGASSSRP